MSYSHGKYAFKAGGKPYYAAVHVGRAEKFYNFSLVARSISQPSFLNDGWRWQKWQCNMIEVIDILRVMQMAHFPP